MDELKTVGSSQSQLNLIAEGDAAPSELVRLSADGKTVNIQGAAFVAVPDEKLWPLSSTNQTNLASIEISPPAVPGIQNDEWITWMAKKRDMISPFSEEQVRVSSDGGRVISYGVSSYGYDARLAPEFKVFSNVNGALVDPKKFTDDCFVERTGDRLIIPPHGFVLARTLEYFRIPDDTLVICLGKSTYARCGLIVNVTPLEPGWCGHVTLEISNTTPLPAVIYANEGICQFLFFRGVRCKVTYADRGGKYMGQTGVTTARP